MKYAIRHITRFRYDAPVTENVMELRMQPRSDGGQQCSSFRLNVRPIPRIFETSDYLGNVIHYFNIPAVHRELLVIADSTINVDPAAPITQSKATWDAIDALGVTLEMWEMRAPSELTPETPALIALADELAVDRTLDPLAAAHQLNRRLHQVLEYDTDVTHVHSPISDALTHRRGVCQDFTHIMLALLRNRLQLPARYVSGYLQHRAGDTSTDGATHAWAEVYIPGTGWIGFDPTNDCLAGERHIRVAVGRDYRDVPPTRGVFTGRAASELSVSVSVRKLQEQPLPDPDDMELADQLHVMEDDGLVAELGRLHEDHRHMQEQQQQ